jgi:hypothetical protein
MHVFLVISIIQVVFGYLPSISLRVPSITIFKLQAFKENEREEQMRIQQEMLARRKNKPKMKEYFDDVEKKREGVAQKVGKNTSWAKVTNEVDPLDKWKEAKDKGELKKIGYEAPGPSRTGFSIPIPVNPIGIERFDEGERFDLRLPYAERGYEDPDADVLGKLGRAFGSIFGRKKSDDGADKK